VSIADRIRAKGKRLETPAAEVKPTTVSAPVVSARPVRLSVDLPPVVHSKLVQWAAKAGPEIGRSRIPAAEVARVLLKRLIADEDLQQSVIDELKREQPR